MDKENLLTKLKLFIETKSVKKSYVEKELGMPVNSLSNFLNGNKELPDKWIEPIEKLIGNFQKTPNDALPAIKAALQSSSSEVKSTVNKLVVDSEGIKEKPKRELLDEVAAKINKDFGEGTVMRFGDKPEKGYQVVSTGSLQLDSALGIGGLPRGRMVEIFGPESSGKTTIALNAIADAQRQGLKCLLIDAENSFDPEYAERLGIEVEKLDYCQPTYGEQGFEVVDRYITAGHADVVVIDSVAAMIPKGELEGEMGDSKMGLHARLMSQVCRKLVGVTAKRNALIIFINQIRNKIGVMFTSPEVTTGGLALQFYASMRLSVTRSTSADNSVMDGDTKLGNLTTVKVIKNKCAPPFKTAKFNIIYGVGIDRDSELIDLAIEKKIIEKSGNWYSFNGTRIGQGKDSVRQMFEANEEFKKEIEDRI